MRMQAIMKKEYNDMDLARIPLSSDVHIMGSKTKTERTKEGKQTSSSPLTMSSAKLETPESLEDCVTQR